jgi:hypothetical protein
MQSAINKALAIRYLNKEFRDKEDIRSPQGLIIVGKDTISLSETLTTRNFEKIIITDLSTISPEVVNDDAFYICTTSEDINLSKWDIDGRWMIFDALDNGISRLRKTLHFC